MTKMISMFLFATVLLFTGCTSLHEATRRGKSEGAVVDVKLPADVVPIKYDLTVWADPSADDFAGNVAIDVEFLSDRRDLYFHAQDLKVVSVHMEGNEGDREAKFSTINDEGLAHIDFVDVVKKGRYRIIIAYRAQYRSDLSGLYKVVEDGEPYLYTQFEPLSARKMFPCFDEPRWKTPFSVKVFSPKGQTVVANAPLKTKIEQDSDDAHVFEITKPLPTYLVALAIGQFDVVEGTSIAKNRYRDVAIPFRGITTKGKGEQLRFALAETPQLVTHLEEYFGTAYPYQKLDVIAVPDFAAGAMENAGAITFRDFYLLLDEHHASVNQRRGFYSIMTHELAHQWFGNSVTMPWWDDLWLNEAFATWLSYKIVDQVKPEHRSGERLLGRSHDAMVQDSMLSARKIREPIVSTHDIHNAFDSITYAKGGAVINMLENYLGAAQFRDAVSSHVKRFEGKTATSKDFLESLTKFSDPSLSSSAETFLNQSGVPRVSLSYSCEGKGLRLKIDQSRYVPIGGKLSSRASWHVPMCVSYDDGGILKKHCFTLNDVNAKIDVPSKTCPSFVMPNAKGQGYYRFSLNLEAWKDLLSADKKHIDTQDRLAIADSLVAELYAGELDFAFVVEGLHGLIDENSAELTSYFVNVMKETSHFWVSQENSPRAHSYARAALKDVYKRLSRSNHQLTSEQVTVKSELAGFLANVVKDKDVRLEMSILGNSVMRTYLGQQEESSMMDNSDEDLVATALSVSLQYENDASFKAITDSLETMTNAAQRRNLLYGVARSREGSEADQIRSLVFNKNLRRNEQMKLFADHLQNPSNQPATFQFLKRNLPKLRNVLSRSQIASLPKLAEGMCDVTSSMELKQLFAPFIANYQGGPRTLAEVIEQIDICAARKSHGKVVANSFFDGLREQTVVEKEKN